MAITRPCYANRELVKRKAGIQLSAYMDEEIDQALQFASVAVEKLTHRIFYPRYAIKAFNWPNRQMGTSWRLWLDDQELILVTSLVSANTEIASDDFFLEPTNSGPPYDYIEINIGSSASTAAFASGSTSQHSILINGLWGFNDNASSAGTLVDAITADETNILVSNTARFSVGDLIRIDDERMLVIEKTFADISQPLQNNLTANVANNLFTVPDGTQFSRGEILTVDSEQMWIVAITGNNLTVKRAYNGSVLAAHTAPATVYAPRLIEVSRAAVGTVATTHEAARALTMYEPPAPVQALCAAYAVDYLLKSQSGFVGGTQQSSRASGSTSKGANPIGSGTIGSDIQVLESRLNYGFIRKGRVFVV